MEVAANESVATFGGVNSLVELVAELIGRLRL